MANIVVAERSGCDRTPIDPRLNEDSLRLRAYIWPDQPHRMARLDQALEVAGSSPITVEQADAAAWTSSRLSTRRQGVVTVLFHSIVWQYIGNEEQQSLTSTIEQAGVRADTDAPFAWLRMEPETRAAAALRLTLWPDGQTFYLADVDYHGRWIHWRIKPDTLAYKPEK